MLRKDRTALLQQPRSLSGLAALLDSTVPQVEEDLQHLLRSLKHRGLRAVIEPAACRHCGFIFQRQKLRKPGKCPHCKRSWIREPRIHLEDQG